MKLILTIKLAVRLSFDVVLVVILTTMIIRRTNVYEFRVIFVSVERKEFWCIYFLLPLMTLLLEFSFLCVSCKSIVLNLKAR